MFNVPILFYICRRSEWAAKPNILPRMRWVYTVKVTCQARVNHTTPTKRDKQWMPPCNQVENIWRLHSNQKSGNQMINHTATKWQLTYPCGNQMITIWSPHGHQVRPYDEHMLPKWQPNDNHMVTKWQPYDNRMVINWQLYDSQTVIPSDKHIVPRRLFFAAQQRISITWSPNYYKKMQRFTTRKNQKEHGPDVK